MRTLRELFCGAHAGLSLVSPLPTHPSARWSSVEFQAFLRFRLALPQNLPTQCVRCGSFQDPFGHHTLCCIPCGTYGRHNAGRDALAATLRSLGFHCRTEVELPGTHTRPADVLVHNLGNEPLTAVDMSFVHSLQPSHPTAAVTAGVAAEARADAKVKQHAQQCASRSWAFVAFVGETTRGWCKAAQRCVQRVARTASLRSGETRADIAARLWLVLANTRDRSVAAQLVRARGPTPNCQPSGQQMRIEPDGSAPAATAPQSAYLQLEAAMDTVADADVDEDRGSGAPREPCGSI